jgi:TonB-dependent SusC/RagA subfamily outer membrane receptor
VDVEDIRVIKGADASSYGSRGANGVIEIILKKG